MVDEWKKLHKDYCKRKSNHRNIKYVLPFVESVCRDVFTTFWNISLKGLYLLIRHLRVTQIPISKQHGNFSRPSSNQIPKKVISDVECYLLTLKEYEGEAIATQTYKRKLANGRITTHMELEWITYLPSHLSNSFLCKRYLKERGHAEDQALLSFTKFYKVWKSHASLRFMKIRKASKNVCDECTILRNLPKGEKTLQSLTSEEPQVNDSSNILSKVSQKEKRLEIHKQEYRACRTAYELDIAEAKVFESETNTFSFDFQQVVDILKVPQQPS